MNDTEKAAFEKAVAELFAARWSTHRIAEWAGSAASGFGKHFTSKEALPLINRICRKINAEIRRENNQIAREAITSLRETFPSGLAKYIRL